MRAVAVGLCLPMALAAVASAQAPRVDFAKEIAPLLVERCVSCHGEDRAKGGIVLSSAGAAVADGEAGPAIVPGQPQESRLLEVIAPPEGGGRPEMPQKGNPLSADQVALIRRWIAEGATWPNGQVLRERHGADRSWWSLQPLAETEPPAPADLPAA
jgi:mono/diheme cytochrome c family protein